MYGFIGGKRKIWKATLKLVLGVFICLFLSILGFLESIGFRGFLVSAQTSADVVINEVQYDPNQPSGSEEWKYEWVELYNKGSGSVNISGWYMKDKYFYEKDKVTSLLPFEIPAGEFLIVAATDEGFRTIFPNFSDDNIIFLEGKIGNGLANGGDRLILMEDLDDIEGVDKLSWESDTFYNTDLKANEGYSLERVPFGTGDFSDQSEPTPGSGVESIEDAEETEEPGDQEESDGENGDEGAGDVGEEDETEEEAELKVSFSSPSEVTLGEEFEVEVSLENAVSGRNYHVKFGANDRTTLDYGKFSKGYTWSDFKDKLLPFSGGAYRWDEFPSIGSGGGTIKARITTSALAGDCAVMVRVRDAEENKNYDSEVRMIRANEAPEEVEEDEDEEDDDSSGSEESDGEVLGEETEGGSNKRSAKKTSSSKSYAFGPFGKDAHQATASPILSASTSANHEATPSSESAFSELSSEEASKSSIISKILLALGGLVIFAAFGFAIAKSVGWFDPKPEA